MGNTASNEDSDEDVNLNQKDEDPSCDGVLENERDPVPLLDMSALFDIVFLRSMASKIPEEIPENILQQHHEHLVRWLEEKLQRNEETVTLSQFYDALLNRSVDRNECRQVFHQFDCDGEGVANVKLMLEFLKKSSGASLSVDLSSVIRTFQSCLFTPGFVDIYNEDKEGICNHASFLLKFVIKNRASASALPYLILNNFNNLINMRLMVLKNHFEKFKKSNVSAQKPENEMMLSSSRLELYPISKCISSYEVSSNKSDAHRLFLRESSYWQSDGSARSHWIRLRMKSNVVIKQLSMGVSSSDQSYMPQHVVILVGRSLSDLHEIKETKIHAQFTGDVILLENAKTFYPIVQINIKRCHSEGCDTRIHSVKMQGYRPVKEQGVTAMDAASGWFLQVLSETATACLPFAPDLRTSILDHTRHALGYLPPLSLSPSSNVTPSFLSLHVLKEVDTFLHKMAKGVDGKMSADGLDVLLSFSLSQGHLVSALQTLMMIKEMKIEELEMNRLLESMDSVVSNFWKKHGHPLQMVVCGCDGGQKDDTSAASNVLNSPWVTSQPYLSEDGKTKVNMFFRGLDRVQVTKLRIKVDKGIRGPTCGLVFVYNHEGEFNLEEHVRRFEFADSWRQKKYDKENARRESGTLSKSDIPVAYFTFTEDWDEAELSFDAVPVGQYVLVKFLEPRHPSAERLSIIGVKFSGFDRKSSQMGSLYDILNTSVQAEHEKSLDNFVCRSLAFFVCLARDQVKPVAPLPSNAKRQTLNVSNISMNILWEYYKTIKNSPVEAGLMLQLVHALFPYLVHVTDKDMDATEAFFKHLCNLVDSSEPTNSQSGRNLLQLAKEVITDGAAVFFPDKEARSKQLFRLIKDISDTNETPSVTLTFQSLCQFFSNVDPSALLDLPSSPSRDFEATQVLRVMGTLVSVAYRECQAFFGTEVQSEKSSHLVHLLCSLQTNLMVWCCCQMESEDKACRELAEDVLQKYVALVATKVSDALVFYSLFNASEMISLLDKLKVSFLSSTLSQLILILSHLCKFMDSCKRMDLLDVLMPVMTQLQKISEKLPALFHPLDSCYWRNMEQDQEIMKVWEVESSHNYENNQSLTQIFSCPGATTFFVEFDSRCETEKRYDYLEFTDARGNKTKYDQKVNTEKWPLNVCFKGGSRLQFVFRSDSSNNEWGYKFKVTAKGSNDVPISWMFDIYLSLSKLIGQFCGASLDITKVLPRSDLPDQKEESELELLRSDLWTTLFRSGPDIFQEDLSLPPIAANLSIKNFLWTLLDHGNEEARLFFNKCQEHFFSNAQNIHIGNDEVDNTVFHVFCALLWHTQTLREDVNRYMESKGDRKLTEGIQMAYSVAESLRRSLVAAQRSREKVTSDGPPKPYDVLDTVKEKSRFLLRFAGMPKIQLKPKCERKMSKIYNRMSSLNSEKGLKVESAMDKYPSFRLVLDFIQDPAWSSERVERLLFERYYKAKAIAQVFCHLVKFLEIVSESSSNIFQVPVVLAFQEMLQHQDAFPAHYAEGLDGCGLELEAKVKSACYAFVRFLVKAIDEASKTGLDRRVQCYDYVVVCGLHFLDCSWQLCDLPLLEELNLPDLYFRLAVGSLSVHDETEISMDQESELEEYKCTMSWLEEVKKCSYSQWSEKHKKDNKKMLQTFSARYSDVLDVEVCCDGCGTALPGGRYRCLECTDVNLCAVCYSDGIVPSDGHSVDHDLMHFLYKCDGCQGFIVGTRIHCNVCEDFDLCLGCQNNNHYPTSMHRPEHSFILCPTKKLILVKETYSLLKSYLHYHVWLLFSSLALSIANALYSKHQDPVECDCIKSAIQLFNKSIHILSMCCLLKSVSSPPCDGNEETLELKKTLERAFMLRSQEKTMGLLGAMIPEPNKTHLAEDVSRVFVSEDFMNMLFSIARGEVGRDSNMQHFALGLIGQLLQRITTDFKFTADMPLGFSYDTLESEAASPVEGVKPDGYKTVNHLFRLGASCLERNGMEWANTMATILQKLFVAPAWQGLMLEYVAESFSMLKKGPSLPSIFALYVVAGFPEVLSLGSLVKFTDSGTEVKYGIVMRHFADKNQTVVVDRTTRRRQTLKDTCTEVVNFNNCYVNEVHVAVFTGIVKEMVKRMKQGEPFSVETSWVLYLILKASLRASSFQSSDERLARLFEADFIRCIIYLSGLGTGFSKQWLLSDLEVLSLMLYTRDNHKMLDSETDHKSTGSPVANEALVCTPDESTSCPLQDLGHVARQTFNTLHTTLHVPMSVLRAIYEMKNCSTDALILAVHENFVTNGFSPSEEVLKLSKKWEGSSVSASAELEADKAIDTGLQSPSSAAVKDTKEFDGYAAEEPMDESQRLIMEVKSNKKAAISRQRHRTSAALLRKELEKDRNSNLTEFLIKVNNALSILYARQVLSALLADKSTSRHIIAADELIGCQVEDDLPYVLDLLNRPESRDTFQKMVENIIQHCRPDGLVSIAIASCDFMEEVSLMTVVKQASSADYELDDSIQDKVHIPGAFDLSIQFDSRCCTDEGDAKFIMSSSADFKQDRRVFSGPNYQWSNFEIPGDVVYFKFTNESGSDWFYKFTVLGSKFGRFDTGYRILDGLLKTTSVVHSLPLNQIWCSLIRVACRQIGQRRLKSIQLLLLLIHSQFRSAGSSLLLLDLGMLSPLWRLHRKLMSGFQDSACILPPLVHALTELFFFAENLAMEWDIAEEYAASLVDNEDISKILLQGLLSVATLSLSIGYRNKATEAFRTLSKAASSEKTKASRSRTSINV